MPHLRRYTAFASILFAVLAALWPLVERAYAFAFGRGRCPLGYASPLARRPLERRQRTSNAIAFTSCALGVNATKKSHVVVSTTGRVLAIVSDESEDIARAFPGATRRACGRASALSPGFIDPHVHVASGGFALRALDLSNVRSMREFLNALATGVESGEWTLGYGWDETRWTDGASPNVKDMNADGRFQGAKIWVTRADAHGGFASAKALEEAGIRKESSVGDDFVDVDVDGEPTGILRERAMARVQALIPERSDGERNRALRAGIEYLLSQGITSVGDFGDIDALVAGVSGYARLWKDFETLAAWDAKGELPIRVTSYMPIADWEAVVAHEAWNEGWVREDARTNVVSRVRLGGVKAFLDGSLGGRTAAMSEPYEGGEHTSGTLMYPPGEDEDALLLMARNADARGVDIAVHAIGDRAVEQALDVLENIARVNGERVTPRRFRIEHAQHLKSPIDSQPSRFARLGATASVQPTQISLDKWSVIEKLGVDRASRAYAFKTFLKNGVHIAGGSDWPIVSADVFAGIGAATNRDGWSPSEALTFDEAMHAYTRGGARALRLEGVVGEITVGALADFVVLDISTPETPRVSATYVGGECVFGECLVDE